MINPQLLSGMISNDFKFSLHQKVSVIVGVANRVPNGFFDAVIIGKYKTKKNNLYVISTTVELSFLTSLYGFSKNIFVVEEKALKNKPDEQEVTNVGFFNE